MERDFTNDPYEEWLRLTGGNPDMGKPEPPSYPAPAVAAPDPQQTINDGMSDSNTRPTYSLPPGKEWFWNPTSRRWTTRDVVEPPPGGVTPPPSPPTPPGPTDGGGGDGSAYSSEGFQWPTYQMPSYIDPGIFDPGPAFTFRDFMAPDPSKIAENPYYQFRFNQGLGALKAQKVGAGTFLSGATGKALQEYGQNFASQEGDNIYRRALEEYVTNRDTAKDVWGSQYGQRKDVHGFKVQNAGNQNTFNQGNNQFDFSGKQRQSELTFGDLFNRWKTEGDWLTSIYAGGDD